MKIGAHVSTSGGLHKSVDRALESGCESIQIFAANPNSWISRPIDPKIAKKFKRRIELSNLFPVVIHTQYLLNLASPNEENYAKTMYALRDAVCRANFINAQYVVTHIGSHKGEGFESSLERIRNAVTSAIAEDDNNTMILLENTSGSGNTIGSSFEELSNILNTMPELNERIGICLDTAHLWGAGYNVSSEDGINQLIAQFDEMIGLNRLKILHLNDSMLERNSKVDRHENIGKGKIGIEAFRVIVNHPSLQSIHGIVETPYINNEPRADVELLKNLRS